MARKKLGEMLMERGIIDEHQLASALAYQRQWGHRLGTALLAKGFITEGELVKVLGEELGIEVVDLSQIPPDPTAIRLLTAKFCETHELFPYRIDQSRGRNRVTCAMGDPLNVAALDEIEFTTGHKVRAVLAPLTQIHSAIRRYYQGAHTVIRRVPTRPHVRPTEARADGEMVVMRPGGREEVVDTRSHRTDPGRHPALVDDDDVVLLREEATGRHDLDGLLREREARQAGRPAKGLQDDLDFLFGINTQDTERLDKLERLFWRLLRLMAKKGLLSKDEILAALKD